MFTIQEINCTQVLIVYLLFSPYLTIKETFAFVDITADSNEYARGRESNWSDEIIKTYYCKNVENDECAPSDNKQVYQVSRVVDIGSHNKMQNIASLLSRYRHRNEF